VYNIVFTGLPVMLYVFDRVCILTGGGGFVFAFIDRVHDSMSLLEYVSLRAWQYWQSMSVSCNVLLTAYLTLRV
jgi:hypothetical protein